MKPARSGRAGCCAFFFSLRCFLGCNLNGRDPMMSYEEEAGLLLHLCRKELESCICTATPAAILDTEVELCALRAQQQQRRLGGEQGRAAESTQAIPITFLRACIFQGALFFCTTRTLMNLLHFTVRTQPVWSLVSHAVSPHGLDVPQDG